MEKARFSLFVWRFSYFVLSSLTSERKVVFSHGKVETNLTPIPSGPLNLISSDWNRDLPLPSP